MTCRKVQALSIIPSTTRKTSGSRHKIFISGCVSLDLYAHASLTPPHQTIVIRPLIFPSLPSSLGITSNRATLTSQGSCSSHPDLPLISIVFLFFCCFAHKDSPPDFEAESWEQCIAFAVWAPLQLHRSAACNPILHSVLLCWGDSTLPLPPLLPALSVSFLLHAVRLEAFP